MAPPIVEASLALILLAALSSASQPNSNAYIDNFSKLIDKLEKAETPADCKEARDFADLTYFYQPYEMLLYNGLKHIPDKPKHEEKTLLERIDHVYDVMLTKLTKDELLILLFLTAFYALSLVLTFMVACVIWEFVKYIIFGQPPTKKLNLRLVKTQPKSVRVKIIRTADNGAHLV